MSKSKTNEMAPSQVRKLILEEHKIIRKKLSALEALLKKTGKKKKVSKEADLDILIEDFMIFFSGHLSTEEVILRPLLEDLDAWGPVRVDHMDKDHRQQRVQIAHIRNLAGKKHYATLFKELQDFIKKLQADMDAEEKDVLSPDILRDDVITVNTCAG